MAAPVSKSEPNIRDEVTLLCKLELVHGLIKNLVNVLLLSLIILCMRPLLFLLLLIFVFPLLELFFGWILMGFLLLLSFIFAFIVCDLQRVEIKLNVSFFLPQLIDRRLTNLILLSRMLLLILAGHLR